MTMTAPSDQQVEAGDNIAAITLQYKAATVLMDVDMWVDVKGIVLTDDDRYSRCDGRVGRCRWHLR